MKTTLLVLAGGMGSRYGGLKQLDEVGPRGECLLDYSIFDAGEAGFDEIVILIRPEIEDDFKEKIGNRVRGITVKYAYQTLDSLLHPNRKKPWGTAHAILSAKDQIDGAFAVINADDYYGKDSFRLIRKFLIDTYDSQDRYAIAGYSLTKTLSHFGSVSRGVCEMNGHGYLKSIKEVKEIFRNGDGKVMDMGRKVEIPSATIVSMNIWGLKQSIFDILERGFKEFLEEYGDHETAEYLIPKEMNEKIHTGELKVSVFPTSSEWFGITYKEDKQQVQESLLSLSLEGQYPMPLW